MPDGRCWTAATWIGRPSCSPQASRENPINPHSSSVPESPRTCWDRARRPPFHCGARSTSTPRLTPASILLGQIVYSDGNVDDAIKIYEQALTHAPNHPHLTAKLKAWRADADASRGFTERRFDRFRVMFQGHADNVLAARATEVLDAAFWRIGKALGTYPSEPVVVMLYTEQQFRDITQAPTWAGGIYDGRIRVPAAWRGPESAVVPARTRSRARPRDGCECRAAWRANLVARGPGPVLRRRRCRSGAAACREDWRDSAAVSRGQLQPSSPRRRPRSPTTKAWSSSRS
jgi:hypothetical protein